MTVVYEKAHRHHTTPTTRILESAFDVQGNRERVPRDFSKHFAPDTCLATRKSVHNRKNRPEMYIPKSTFLLLWAYLSHAWLAQNRLHQAVFSGTPNPLLYQKGNCSQYRDLLTLSVNSARNFVVLYIYCSNQRNNSATLLPPICNDSDREGADEGK